MHRCLMANPFYLRKAVVTRLLRSEPLTTSSFGGSGTVPKASYHRPYYLTFRYTPHFSYIDPETFEQAVCLFSRSWGGRRYIKSLQKLPSKRLHKRFTCMLLCSAYSSPFQRSAALSKGVCVQRDVVSSLVKGSYLERAYACACTYFRGAMTAAAKTNLLRLLFICLWK